MSGDEVEDRLRGMFGRAPARALQIVGTPNESAGISSQSDGRKYDAGKSRPALMPPSALIEVGHVLAYGASKYTVGDSPGAENWKQVDRAVERYSDAALRHFYAWLGGERNDPETKRHHLAHAVCCLLFILWFELRDS